MKIFILSVVGATFCQSTTAISPPQRSFVTSEGQQPLKGAKDNEDASRDSIFSAKITDKSHCFFRIEMGVGTPPQPFHAGLDLGWTDSFLPSAQCVTGCPHLPSYSSLDSSTYVELREAVCVNRQGLAASGYSSQDTFHVGGLSITNQLFAEMTDFKDYRYWDRPIADYAPFGLSRFPIRSPDSTLKEGVSPWQNMVQQKKLQKNIFSLKLSKSPNEDGEIMFGGVNHDLYTGELMSVPTTKVMSPPNPIGDDLIREAFNSGWQVAAHSASFDKTQVNLGSYTAIFSTKYPWIQVPERLGKAIDNAFVYHSMPGHAGAVDCNHLGVLPDLVVRLGVEGNATLRISPWDYALPWDEHDDNPTRVCVPPLWFEFDGEAPEYILLGSQFLRGVYSVFDQDEGTISFAQLKRDL